MMEIPILKDDGLLTPEIGPWGIEKYGHVKLYSTVFIKSMRKHWKCLIYIDLFSGAGRSRIKGTNRIIPGSPLIALNLDKKFDKYIFCEKDIKKYNALANRIKRDYSHYDVYVVNGDANLDTDKLLQGMPQPSSQFPVLSFCFVDPSKVDDLIFCTLQTLSTRYYIDFLVLVSSGMDAARTMGLYYFRPRGTKLDNFLGRIDWRQSFKEDEQKGISKEEFVVKEFCKSMISLGFKDPGFANTVPIFSDDKNLLLYRLVLFSRRELGNKFWREVKKSLKLQREIMFPPE